MYVFADRHDLRAIDIYFRFIVLQYKFPRRPRRA